ncbi:adenylyl-sulfate kinase [Jiulongibacter sp. NS-SX5]|uniref:adenylyl-sulfate kinase n=1 Tax=Jiulongibacter sp. NS-SX5 TaxID=3463854 RepID=UPI0040596DCF
MSTNITPVFDQMLTREERESLLKQRGLVIWLTGLSGSGKSTLGIALERRLFELGYKAQMLDGDNIRGGLNQNLTFSKADRDENIRRVGEVSKLYLNSGMIVINSFISPTIKGRELAKSIIGEDDFAEVYISTPLEVCERRDVKGLYKKVREGKIKNFTGIDSPYEAPQNPVLELDTSQISEEEALERLLELVLPRVKYD